MGGKTGISWTDHTFNPVWGCHKISPGCKNCYAADWAERFGTEWGKDAKRREFGDSHWNEPRKWNKQAEKLGIRSRVFCASMADVFDDAWPPGTRDRLWALIRETPNLDWQVLTKRPENIIRMLPEDWETGYPNVWLGVTTENQEQANRRIGILWQTHAKFRFASYEPALEPVDFGIFLSSLDWVIVGGESGRNARPFDPAWATDVIAQCKAANVAVFHKQMGELWARENNAKQRHGADPAEWPEEFRVQDFPIYGSDGAPVLPSPRRLPVIA